MDLIDFYGKRYNIPSSYTGRMKMIIHHMNLKKEEYQIIPIVCHDRNRLKLITKDIEYVLPKYIEDDKELFYSFDTLHI